MGTLRHPIQHIAAYHAELTRLRRDLHAHPELGFEESRTAALVASELERYGVDEIHRGVGKTGLVAVIRGALPGRGRGEAGDGDPAVRAIGLRADMDALPLREDNEFPWRSGKIGVMHACGHDGHTTMLLGAARYLAATRQFSGEAVCIFQPAEEGLGGAKAMLDDGLFERFPVDAVYSMHNWPQLPPGRIGLAAGPMMAAADRITITVCGPGGHGAHPELCVDTVLVAAQIVNAVQSVVSRNVNPNDQAVVSLCAVQGGDLSAMSVMPRNVTMVGTVRSFRAEVQALVEQRLQQLVQAIAQGYGATAEVRYERIYPATINTPDEAQHARRVAEELVGPSNVVPDLPPSMGAEDFAFMLQARPGAYLRLGQGGDAASFLHTARYDFNDVVLPLGAALYARLAERALTPPVGAVP